MENEKIINISFNTDIYKLIEECELKNNNVVLSDEKKEEIVNEINQKVKNSIVITQRIKEEYITLNLTYDEWETIWYALCDIHYGDQFSKGNKHSYKDKEVEHLICKMELSK